MADVENQGGTLETRADLEKDESSLVTGWLEAIDLQREEEKSWREDCNTAIDVYEGKDGEKGSAFNLYHANINTLAPALFNSKPRPDVRRRFGDADQASKEAATIIERVLSHDIDVTSFDEAIEEGVFDLAVYSRGQARVNLLPGDETSPIDETVTEYVPWENFVHGPGYTWSDVEWVAFRKYFRRDQIEEALREYGADPDIAGKISYDVAVVADADDVEALKDIYKRATVWEVWDKVNRRVLFICDGYKDAPILNMDDPLGLEEFFPCPKPMLGVRVRLKPLCEYSVYEELLDELDAISRRIKNLVASLRVRGLFGAVEDTDISAIAEAGDNEFIEAGNIMAVLEQGGLDKLIHYWPMEPAVKAIQALYQQREAIKQNIYEVTGLSDIVRGQSNPNETLGAQEIKTQWGTLRLQKRQGEVQRFVRDILRIKAELIANHFQPQTLAIMTGVQSEQMQEVAQLFQNDLLRTYRIDIETDSTIQADLTHEQGKMTSFIEGAGAFFQGVAPIVESGAMSKEAAVKIFVSFTRSLGLGKEAEDALEEMAQDKGPTPEQMQMQQQQMQEQQQAAQQQLEAEKAQAQEEIKKQAEQQKAQAALEKMKVELDFQRRDHDARRQDLEKLKMEVVDDEKLNFEKAKHREDMDMRRDELNFQRKIRENEVFNASLDGESEEGGPVDEFRVAFRSLASGIEALAGAAAETNENINELKAYVAAPAVIERDKQGRVVGASKQIKPKEGQ